MSNACLVIAATHKDVESTFWCRSKKLTDAQLVCLAVAQVILGARAERHWLRIYARSALSERIGRVICTIRTDSVWTAVLFGRCRS